MDYIPSDKKGRKNISVLNGKLLREQRLNFNFNLFPQLLSLSVKRHESGLEGRCEENTLIFSSCAGLQ